MFFGKWKFTTVCGCHDATTRQDDRIISGGGPVNNWANIVWHSKRVLREDVSRGVGRSACAYTSTSPVAIATLFHERIAPLGFRISTEHRPCYIPSASNNMTSRSTYRRLIHCLRFIPFFARYIRSPALQRTFPSSVKQFFFSFKRDIPGKRKFSFNYQSKHTRDTDFLSRPSQ